MGETLAGVASHLSSRHVSRVIYGAIIGLALLVALEDHPPAAGVVAASLIGTAVVVGLAELYSEVIGTETRQRRGVSRSELRALAQGATAVGVGIAVPSGFFVLAALGAMETGTAFTAAKWTGLGLIAVYGFWASRLAGAGMTRSLLHAAAVAVIGSLIIVLKALLH
jgi:hypothetical protein